MTAVRLAAFLTEDAAAAAAPNVLPRMGELPPPLPPPPPAAAAAEARLVPEARVLPASEPCDDGALSAT